MKFLENMFKNSLWYRRFVGGKWYVYAWGGCEENYITIQREPLEDIRYKPLYVEDFG